MKWCLLLLLILPITLQAQEDSCGRIVDFPDVEAQFPGGMVEMHQFIVENLEYPEGIFDIDMAPRLYLSFIVCVDGSIHSLELGQDTSESIREMVSDIYQKMPNWIPAKENGVPVATRVRLPIIIELN